MITLLVPKGAIFKTKYLKSVCTGVTIQELQAKYLTEVESCKKIHSQCRNAELV